MKAILFIIIGIALGASAVGLYLIVQQIKKSGMSFYRKRRTGKLFSMKKINEEILENERYLKIHKEVIRYSVQCRNIASKVMNEIGGLVEQRNAGHPLRTVDMQILDQLEGEMKALQKEMKACLNKYNYTRLENLRTTTYHLISTFQIFHQTISKFSQSTDKKQNDTQFIQNVKDVAGEYYHEIAENHDHVIGLFQKYFSDAE